MKTAVAYARYSSDMQRQESIDAQVRAIKDYCKKNQILMKKIYVDEALSATTDQREQFLQMIADSKEGAFDYCIVHKLDRFSRSRYDSAFYKRQLKINGVRVISVLEQLDDSPESIILESVLEGMAEYYSKNLAREVRKGLKENALVAKHNGGTPPLGYDVCPDKSYAINHLEAQAVLKIFEMYSQYYGFGLICNELNQLGYRTKRGQPFGKNSIHDILINEKYIGRYVYNKRASKATGNRVFKEDSEIIRIDDAMPRIISDDLWNKVHRILKEKQKPRRNKKRFYLLTGKMICEECGAAYTGSGYAGGRNGRIYYQYSCSNRKANRGDCQNKSVRCEAIENFILSKLKQCFSEDAIEELTNQIFHILNQTSPNTQSTAKELQAKIDKTHKTMEKTWEMYYADLLPMEQISNQIKTLNGQLQFLQLQLSNLSYHEQQKKFDKEEIKTFLLDTKNRLESTDEEVLRSIIDTFVEQVVVGKEEIKAKIRISPKANADSAKVGGDDLQLTITLVLSRRETRKY